MKIPFNPQKDHSKTTPSPLKEQMSLTLERRSEYFLSLFFLLTNLLFSYIYFHSNDLCHVGRLAQLARALARQARGHWFKSSNAHFGSPCPLLYFFAPLPLALQISEKPSQTTLYPHRLVFVFCGLVPTSSTVLSQVWLLIGPPQCFSYFPPCCGS